MRVRPDADHLKEEDTGSSLWLLGVMRRWGWGGAQKNEEEAYRCFSRAAAKGHLLSRWKIGWMTANGYGVQRDDALGNALMVEAAELGCPEAFLDAGHAYQGGWGVQKSYRRAAQWFLKAGHFYPTALLKRHPLECTPFGEWTPQLSSLVAPEILDSMRATMLLCKRLQLPRYVALLIASYVCTEGEEWVQLMRSESGE